MPEQKQPSLMSLGTPLIYQGVLKADRRNGHFRNDIDTAFLEIGDTSFRSPFVRLLPFTHVAQLTYSLMFFADLLRLFFANCLR